MRALLLAAGLGTRLRPITDTVPKCLVPIRGRPLLELWFDLLFESDLIERALVNLHYLPDTVRKHVHSSRWRERIDLVHEEVLLGTGGTVRANLDWLGREAALVVHADNLSVFNMASFVGAFKRRPKHCAMTMLTFRSDNPRSCGIVEVDPQGIVVAFHEKVENPPSDLANGAVYIFGPEVLVEIGRAKPRFLDLSTDIIPQFVGRISIYDGCRYHRDIGTMESLRRAEEEYASFAQGAGPSARD